MKAMLFSAGLGTRLRPLTDSIPKALVVFKGRPLLEWNLLRLKKFGFTEVIINVHHFAEKIEAFLKANENFGMQIAISDEREQLLETGGGLKKAAWFFDAMTPFLVSNADVICDLDLGKLFSYHIQKKADATLAVMDRKSSRYFLFDKEMRLAGWKNEKTNELKIPREVSRPDKFAFSGIQIIDPIILKKITRDGVFSMVDVYLDLADELHIVGMPHSGTWLDLGTVETLKTGEKVGLKGYL